MICSLLVPFALPLLAVLLSAVCSRVILWLLIPALATRIMDTPNDRSSHQRPTPSGGGIAFVSISVVVSFFALLFNEQTNPFLSCVPLLLLPLAIVGLFDDYYRLGSGLRYSVQIATAILLLFSSTLSTPFPDIYSSHFVLGWLIYLLVISAIVIGITAVINFVNFMDGLDGLVSVCMAVSITTLSIKLSTPWPSWTVVGSLLGFLTWNWSPAKVFMGDVGSTFLGALFAGLVLQSSNWAEAFGLLLLLSPLIGDAFFCVIRRLFARQNVFRPHRLHLFQRLHQAGWSHASVSYLYLFSTVSLSLALIAGGLHLVISVAVVELLIGIWLDQYIAIPFTSASRG